MNLAYAALMGDANLVNEETELIQEVKKEDIMGQAQKVLSERNASILRYQMRS